MSDHNERQQHEQHRASTYSIVTGPLAPVDDFLTEHLGQLLIRQPISPKSVVTRHASRGEDQSFASHARSGSVTSFDNGSSIGSRSTFASAHSRSAGDARSTIHARAGSSSFPSVGSALEHLSPECDDLFTSFFSATSLNRTPSLQRTSAVDAASISSAGSGSRGAASNTSGVVSMSTTFGVRRKSITRTSGSVETPSGITSTASTTTEESSLFMPSYRPQYQSPSVHRGSTVQPQRHPKTVRQQSRTSDEAHSQPSSLETAPTTPPESNTSDGVDPLKLNTRWHGAGSEQRRHSSAGTSPGESTTSRVQPSEGAPTTINATMSIEHRMSENEEVAEERKLKNFHEGGVVEPPETAEGSCILRSDMHKSGRKCAVSSSSHSSGAKGTRHTSMMSARFLPDYFSSAHSETRGDGVDRQGGELGKEGSCIRGECKVSSSSCSGKERQNISWTGQEAATVGILRCTTDEAALAEASDPNGKIANVPIKLVPISDDGRTFRFVSSASVQADGMIRSDRATSSRKTMNSTSARHMSLC